MTMKIGLAGKSIFLNKASFGAGKSNKFLVKAG